ncbi:MAG: hypothetical protein R3287_15985 [Anderseniella sp.]|nr:hypothetical protein [Anderseniella sp.]
MNENEDTTAMSKPIIDKASVSIDFPDKFFHGSFSRSSRYGVTVDSEGVHISLDRAEGEKRHVAFHLHHHLFSDILTAIAETIDAKELSPTQREDLKEAAELLIRAVGSKQSRGAG